MPPTRQRRCRHLRTQAAAVRHAQAVLLGRTPDQAPEPLTLDALHLPDRVPVSVPSDLLHQRPDILAAEAAVRATADEAGAATAALFPSLTLSAAYGRGGFDWSTFTSPAGAIWSVGASLTQPLFHGGALVARKHQYERPMMRPWRSTSRPCWPLSRISRIPWYPSMRTRTRWSRRSVPRPRHTPRSAIPSRDTGWGDAVLCDADRRTAVSECECSVRSRARGPACRYGRIVSSPWVTPYPCSSSSSNSWNDR